jgi:hypothetical protein
VSLVRGDPNPVVSRSWRALYIYGDVYGYGCARARTHII